MADDRIEHDSLGAVRVPADALWGAQTQRAVENFPISGLRLDAGLVRALALIKAEAARVNVELGVLHPATGAAIVRAARAIAAGAHADAFPVDVFQTGSGTSSNMNMNEVIARLASAELDDPAHPNDDVNASQSSNDVFPTAVHLAALTAVTDDLLPAARTLERSLQAKSEEFAHAVKAGRTHLMDAVPVTFGQEFGGYAAQVRDAAARVEAARPRVGVVPLGGTAVGTGLNTPAGFAEQVVAAIAATTGLPVSVASDPFAAQAARDELVGLSGDLRVLAVALTKIADDIRWMNSGPHAGLAELHVPDLQPGSSIMPGKVNPVLAEVAIQVAAQVVGNDATIAWCGARGNFELNVTVPVMARNLLESIALLANTMRVFATRCVDGVTVDESRARRFAEASPAVATALNRVLGYETVAAVVHEAEQSGRTIREVVLAQELLDAATLDTALDVEKLARPHE